MDIKLSIIIVNWNTAELLGQCLESIYIYPPQTLFEVLVVDNASTDPSVCLVKERFPQVLLIENRNNIGFAQANNQAIRQCSGQYVLLLNPDTKVKAGAFDLLLEFMEANLQTGAVGAHILNPDETLQLSCYPTPTLAREFWRLLHLDTFWPYGSYDMSDWNLDGPREVDILLGACLLLRRTTLDQTGLLDENYFIYSEEVDLCYRIQKAGWRLYWLPQAKVIHYGGQSTQQVAAEMFMRLYESKLIFIRKHYGWLAGQLYKFVLFVSSLFRIVLSPLAWLERPSRRRRHLMLASRYWELVRALPGM